MPDEHYQDRERMLRQIEVETEHTAAMTGRQSLDPRVLLAMAQVPRHVFVPEGQQTWAYDNSPQPLSHGQTISQPFVVALMTDLLKTQPDHVVLEIGTGSGYQTAILAYLVRQVYTLERISPLAQQAAQRLQALQFNNIEIKVDDGHQGWEAQAPFNGIMVTAAATEVPQALLRQLKPGGRLVIPVGLPHRTQDLQLILKDKHGRLSKHSLLPVAFVPLLRGDPDSDNPGKPWLF